MHKVVFFEQVLARIARRRAKLHMYEELEAARTALTSAISIIDRTVSKGVLHANTGARYKSRLTHHVQKLG